jgi:aminotransferase
MQSITKSGILSKKIDGMKPSGIRRIHDMATTMSDVISLELGEPDFVTPTPILDAGFRSLQAGGTHYTANLGKIELRRAISQNLQRLYGVYYDPASEIIVTVGVSEALYLLTTALIDPGDQVIIPTPGFVSYPAEVRLAGGIPVEVPCKVEDNFQLDLDLLYKAITPRTKLIFLGYPANPTGAVASREKLKKIGEIAVDNNLLIVSDEIYDRLVYDCQHVCVPSLGEQIKSRTILLGGFSKAYAMTGWRIGYACGPAEIIEGMMRIHQYSVMCAPTMAQEAAIEALTNGEKYVQEMVAEYDRRRRLIVNGLNKMGLFTFEPHGAFYVFPMISETGMDDETFSLKLLQEEHVAVVPGSAFGKGGEGFVRCSYATSYKRIEEALFRIEKFLLFSDQHRR